MEARDPPLLRSRVYGFLRRIFTHEVDASLLAWCREQDRLGLWSELQLDLKEVLNAADSEAALEQLAVDFCQLFITSGAWGSPHASVQVQTLAEDGGESLLWGDPASAVKRLYHEAGFELEEEAHLLPDALGVEFEFMERLCHEESVAKQARDSADVQRLQDLQRRMLKEHLARWVPAYGRKLKSRASTDFYRAMTDLAADFVEWDAREERATEANASPGTGSA